MSEAQLFKGGIPYAPDVKRLCETFPVPELTEGRVITHEVLEALIDSPRSTQRYYGVVNSWISKQKHENAVIIIWEHGQGVKVLNPAEVLGHAETRTRQKSKQLVRTLGLFSWVDGSRLDETGRQRLGHMKATGAKIAAAVQDAQRELAVELSPVRSLPKRIK